MKEFRDYIIIFVAVFIALTIEKPVVVIVEPSRLEIAKVISAEACGEGERGMQAVANTIYNRSVLWNKSLDEVIRQKNQYFGYTASNKERLYKECHGTADYLANNIEKLEDLTEGAIYFLQDNERKGDWIGNKTVKIGVHTFYREKINE